MVSEHDLVERASEIRALPIVTDQSIGGVLEVSGGEVKCVFASGHRWLGAHEQDWVLVGG